MGALFRPYATCFVLVYIESSVDPFLYSTFHAIHSHHLMNLRKKARVYVKDGVVLIGGLDETGLVPENCVFLQVEMAGGTSSRSQDGNRFEVITVDVMVTKHPVMHPG